MSHAKQVGITLAVVVFIVVAVTSWSRPSVAAAPQTIGGDPALSDLVFLPAGDVRGSGKYTLFMLERENSSHRWFMRFDSETGTLTKLTADKGWVPIASTADIAR